MVPLGLPLLFNPCQEAIEISIHIHPKALLQSANQQCALHVRMPSVSLCPWTIAKQ